MQRKFSLKNLSTNQNQRIRLEAIDRATLEKFNEDYEFFEPMSSIDLCLSPNISQISCDGATQSSGVLDIEGQWILDINGNEVPNKTSLLDLIAYLQNTGDFEVEVEDELDFSEEFDYLVVSYSWRSGNGQDLDTRTSIVEPSRNIEVGWARDSADSDYLLWGGDNTAGEGSEAVLINTKDLINDFPNLKSVKVLLKAFWYSSVGDGRFSLNFKTYKGGTMSPDGYYNFLSVDGTLIDNFTITCYTSSQDKDGVPLGTLDIDLVNKRSTFTVLDSTAPILQPPTDLMGVFSI